MHFKTKAFLGISLHSSSHSPVSDSNLTTPSTSLRTTPIQSRNDTLSIAAPVASELLPNSRKNSVASTHSPHNSDEDHHTTTPQKPPHHSHMSELKRFFKKKSSTSKVPTVHASSSSINLDKVNNSDPFGDSSELVAKYGRLGKILGSGAGGSVRLLTRPSDGMTFAVKEFRTRRPNEQMKEYVKKCTAEFCIGSTLDHPNIIKTLDITNFQDHYFEVMEYCPVDFFAIVMSGRMTRNEINCCFKQLVSGVQYLHSMGLAHRDLKLDNCVVTNDGILKIIDFGSAVVFKYPYEDKIVKAHGVMGSDPYLAPEVLTSTDSYDSSSVDIWSLAIIYCCMYLKRFPWKSPKMTDSSFKLYSLPDDQPHDYAKAAVVHNELIKKRKEERKRLRELENLKNLSLKDETTKSIADENTSPVLEQQQPPKSNSTSSAVQLAKPEIPIPANSSASINHHNSIPQKFNGPYRLMRLLPHSARPILSKMLTIDPTKRSTMRDILNDEWFQGIHMCTLDSKGNYVSCSNHVHTKVDGDDDSSHLEFYKAGNT